MDIHTLTPKNIKLILIPIFILVCFVIGLVLGYINTSRIISLSSISKPTPIPQIEADQGTATIPTAPPDLDRFLNYAPGQVSADSKYLSILFLGYGGAGHDGGYLTDAMVLAFLDVTKQKLALIHIPRDIWVTIKVGETDMPMKINSALAMGTRTSNYPTTTVSKDTVMRASTLTKQAVTTVTGLPVDFVVGVDFNGFSQAIDSLKGIEVNVPSNFDDPLYPIKGRELELCGHSPEEVTAMSATMSGLLLERQFPCRYEHLHFEAGKQKNDWGNSP